MNPNTASDKAFQKVKDFARKTDKEEAFWREIYTDVERRKRLIELEKVKDEVRQ